MDLGMDPDADLQLSTRRQNGHRLVEVAGQIDIMTAQALHAYLCHAIETAATGTAPAVVELDLARVTFMDARGLSALLGANRHAHLLRARLQLANIPANLARLLAITGLDQVFTLVPAGRRTGALAVAGPAQCPPQRGTRPLFDLNHHGDSDVYWGTRLGE